LAESGIRTVAAYASRSASVITTLETVSGIGGRRTRYVESTAYDERGNVTAIVTIDVPSEFRFGGTVTPQTAASHGRGDDSPSTGRVLSQVAGEVSPEDPCAADVVAVGEASFALALAAESYNIALTSCMTGVAFGPLGVLAACDSLLFLGLLVAYAEFQLLQSMDALAACRAANPTRLPPVTIVGRPPGGGGDDDSGGSCHVVDWYWVYEDGSEEYISSEWVCAPE
jgi:hypothetical protein